MLLLLSGPRCNGRGRPCGSGIAFHQFPGIYCCFMSFSELNTGSDLLIASQAFALLCVCYTIKSGVLIIELSPTIKSCVLIIELSPTPIKLFWPMTQPLLNWCRFQRQGNRCTWCPFSVIDAALLRICITCMCACLEQQGAQGIPGSVRPVYLRASSRL